MYEWGVADNSASILGNGGDIFTYSKTAGNVYFMGQGGNNGTTTPLRKKQFSINIYYWWLSWFKC